ncbi:hypothetical protein L6164_002240 [Bauhinia variegata]|uniref:Uncharacterized protein n=1 Tax=Bauhinia variegata TaxID=167791 RepID=A0ACB9PXR5_BAUVA|nr:hypothetical protein L6164_002240 [Bauhinia variegata]
MKQSARDMTQRRRSCKRKRRNEPTHHKHHSSGLHPDCELDTALRTQTNADDYSWMVPIQVMLGSIGHREVQACSICRVPHKLRKQNDDPYKPKAVAIGELGVICFKWNSQNGSTCDNVVRPSYGGNIELEPHELTKLMLLDGCFVLELLLRLHKYMATQNPKNVEDDQRVTELVLNAFGYPLVQSSNAAHLLHLMHSSIIPKESNQVKQARQELKRCATKLRAAGITIGPANSTNVNMGNKFVCRFEFNIN